MVLSPINLYAQLEITEHDLEDSDIDSLLNCYREINGDISNKELTLNDFYIGWSDGNIFKTPNNELEGRIKIITSSSNYRRNSSEIYFKVDLEDAPKKYSANNIYGFYKEGLTFHSKKLPNGKIVFIEILEEGNINLYIRKYIIPTELNGKKGIRIVTDYFIETIDNPTSLVGPIPSKHNEFANFIDTYINDFPSLSKKVMDYNYGYRYVREIIQLYNKHQ